MPKIGRRNADPETADTTAKPRRRVLTSPDRVGTRKKAAARDETLRADPDSRPGGRKRGGSARKSARGAPDNRKGDDRKKTPRTKNARAKTPKVPRTPFIDPATRRRWDRRIAGWRRDLGRAQPFLLFLLLSVVTLAIYGVWASGLGERGVASLRTVGDGALLEAGLTIDEVTVSGQTIVSRDQVLGVLGAEQGAPLLDFDTREARARLEDIPWVRSAKVMRLLPDRLHVEIVEREAFAIWQSDQQFYLIDSNGVVLEPLVTAGAQRFGHLPRVVGAGANQHAAALMTMLDEAPALRSRLVAASRVADRRWNLRLDNGMEIRLPDADVERAIRDIATLDAEHRLLARRIAVVDLRDPDVLVVRPESDATGEMAGEADLGAAFQAGARRIVTDPGA